MNHTGGLDAILADGSGVRIEKPVGVEAKLQAILEAITANGDRDTFGVKGTRLRGTREHGITQLDLVGAALANTHFRINPTYRLSFLIMTERLQVLEVRLHDPQSEPIDILRVGPVIESPIPIQDIYITTEPGFLADPPLFILSGELHFPNLEAKHHFGNPTWARTFPGMYTTQNVGDVASIVASTGPPRAAPIAHRVTAVGRTLMFSGLNNLLWRVKGRVTVENPSSTSTGQVSILLRDAGDTVTHAVIDRFIIPTVGSLIFTFDTEFIRSAANTSLFMSVDDLGVALNPIQVAATVYQMAPSPND